MFRLLFAIVPMLLRRKRSWLLIALVAGFTLFTNRGGFSLPDLGNFELGMPDVNVASLWKEPRDILVDRVEDARDAQVETVEEFKSALEKFKDVTSFTGGDLEKQYNVLNSAFESSESSVKDVDKRIDKVTNAANDLLEEWKVELDDYHDASLRQRAQAQFDDTRMRADQLIAAMRTAESRSKPVLDAFRDQVLYLKHNLNMQAIASLDEEAETIESDVDALIREMEVSISEANAFIDTLLASQG